MLLLLSINAYILYVAHLSLHLFTYVLHMVEAVFQTVVFVLMFIRETGTRQWMVINYLNVKEALD